MRFKYSLVTRILSGGLLAILLLLSQGRVHAHPMAPDLTVAQLKIHYHLIAMTLRAPAGEVLDAAKVGAAELNGEETKKAVLDKLTQWLPHQFSLEKDGKTLSHDVVAADYRYYSVGPEVELSVHYTTDKPAEKLKVTTKFAHTIISTGGVQFELRGEATREFTTQANLSKVWNNVVDFAEMGMEHLFTGPDHILFICTLIFALSNFRSAVKLLTGFTVGHSITLLLSTFNVISIPARFADMGIALTIIYVGVENIVRKEPPKNRWMLVTVFGLVHGMGFSSGLKEVGLPEQGLVLCLLGFNVGIELAQIIIVAIVYPILSRVRWHIEAIALDKEQGQKRFKVLLNIGSAITACMGCYWFVERLISH